MAKRKTKRRKAPRRTAKPAPMPGWVWGVIGLAFGLSVAAAIYVKDRESSTSGPVATIAKPIAKSVAKPATNAPSYEIPEKTEPRFKFYDMLPNFEVVIPEEDTVVRNDARPVPLDTPGIYVLQAGSFSTHTDADRMKARLALLGISSRIQKVSVDDKEYHRIRIGPVDSLDKLNALRAQLRDASVDVMVIRVGG